MAPSFFRTAVALLPCAAAIVLFARLMPLVVEAPLIAGPRDSLRLDPLVLTGWLILGLSVARPGTTLLRTLRLVIGAFLAGLALAAAVPALHLLLLYLASLMLLGGLGPGWLFAVGALSLANLEFFTRTTGFTHLVLPALVCASLSGSGGLPWPTHWLDGNDFEVALRPFWLLSLLRSLENGPWPLAWTLFVPLVGSVAALVAAAQAMTARECENSVERLLAAVALWALACIGVNTTLGVVAALWVMLAHSLLLVFLWKRERTPRLLIGCLLFVAGWWTVAALAGAKAFLLAGLVWLAGAALTWASFVRTNAPARDESNVFWRRWSAAVSATLAATVLIPLALFSGLVTRTVGLRIADGLGAGLTAFGLVDTWSWIGVGALDAARQRVGLLPIVPLTLLWLVVLAVIWLAARLMDRRMLASPLGRRQLERTLPALLGPAVEADEAEREIRSRVWWLDTGRDG